MQRYFKKCEDFCMCGAIGQGDDIIAETSEENKTLFQIVIRGNGRVAKAFDSDYIDLVEKEVIDVSNLVGTNRVYQPYEDFELYGFNALNQDDKWSFRIKVRENKSILGMREFSLQHPRTRKYLNEYIFHKILKLEKM